MAPFPEWYRQNKTGELGENTYPTVTPSSAVVGRRLTTPSNGLSRLYISVYLISVLGTFPLLWSLIL
jgi:hypothetical protein